MPTYSFKCKSCGELAEITSSIHTQYDTPACSKCEIPLVRFYGNTSQALQFKGNGWAHKEIPSNTPQPKISNTSFNTRRLGK